jgi:hypothetical protein
MDDKVAAIGKLFCKARREGDRTNYGCPVFVFGEDLQPEPICERCREDAESAIGIVEKVDG